MVAPTIPRTMKHNKTMTKSPSRKGDNSSKRPSKTKDRRRFRDNAERYATRVCIRNLPPSVTDVELRRHLQQTTCKDDMSMELTDCRILRDKVTGKSKGIAFVGVTTAEQASHLIDQLHKTYFRTARLHVERALKEGTTPRQGHEMEHDDKEKDSNTDTGKKKDATLKVDRRKEEFLAVMGVKTSTTDQPQKTFWSNDDVGAPQDAVDADVASDSNDEEEDDRSDMNDSEEEDDADPLVPTQTNTKRQSTTSDLDFLRSKQVETDDLEEMPEDSDPEKQVFENDDNDSTSSSDSGSEIMNDGTGVAKDQQPPEPDSSASPLTSSRLFVRNLPFSATEDDLLTWFAKHGYPLQSCHLPVDDQDRTKGFGFLTFANTQLAEKALQEMDKSDFQGRLMHLLPARPALNDNGGDMETDGRPLSYKEQQERKRQQEADNPKGWSASYVRGDAVVDNLAERLGLRKGDILAVKDGLSSGDAAVRLALGETAIIEENRKYFAQHGIDMEALVSVKSSEENTEETRSKTSLLVKNLPADTTTEELLKVFGGTGCTPQHILLPPSRTIAVVEYANSTEAKKVFRKLAYRRFKSVPLYLEWAPLAAKLDSKAPTDMSPNGKDMEETKEDDDYDDILVTGPTTTFYIKNLNFATTEQGLKDFCAELVKNITSVRIPQKVHTIKSSIDNTSSPTVRSVSMGYGFVEVATSSQESAKIALKKLQGSILDGHTLQVSISQKHTPSSSLVVSTTTTNKTLSKSSSSGSKLIVRNVPFQATRKELLQLFGSFGQLRKIRLPKKFDGSHRGFAFCEYMTSKDAHAAKQALSKTHLYGRHLVLEWAEEKDSTTNGMTTTTSSSSSSSSTPKHDRDPSPTSISRNQPQPPQPLNKRIRF